jgi:hypothetical protein
MVVDGMVFATIGSDLVLVNPRSGTEIDRIDLGRVPAMSAAATASIFVAASGSAVTAVVVTP